MELEKDTVIHRETHTHTHLKSQNNLKQTEEKWRNQHMISNYASDMNKY